jgi:hypothetical protein
MTLACLYLNLELSICELQRNGYVLLVYPFIILNHNSIQRNDTEIFPLNNADT